MTIEPDNDLIIFKERLNKNKGKQADTSEHSSVKDSKKNESESLKKMKNNVALSYVTEKESNEEVKNAIVDQLGSEYEAVEILGKSHKKHIDTEKESRKAAKGLFCVWHSWRGAYAICDYCRRPFCFEDLIEQSGRYYCLEDINYAAKMYDRGYNLSAALLSGMLLFIPIIIVIYLNNSALINMLSYINNVGLQQFISAPKVLYINIIFEFVISLLSFIAGLIMVTGARRSAGFGIFSSVLLFSFFIYIYIQTHATLPLFISIIGIVAFFLIVYSRSEYSDETLPYNYSRPESQQNLDWPDVGNF